MTGIRRNMGAVDRLARSLFGMFCIALGVFAPEVVDNSLLNGVIVLFGTVNLVSSAVRFCPAYAIGNFSTIAKSTDSGAESDTSGSRKIRKRIMLIAVSAVTVTLALFSAILFHVIHDLAMSKDLMRGEAAAVLAVGLYSNHTHPDFSSQTAEREIYNDLLNEIDIIVFHDEEGRRLFSDYQRLGDDPSLLEKLLGTVTGNTPAEGGVKRQMIMHDGEGLLKSTLPVSDQTWVSILVTKKEHGELIGSMLTPKLIVVFLCVLWLTWWGVTYGLRKYTQQTEKSARELRYRSMHDPLTGLRNRIGLDEILSQRIDDTDDQHNGFAVILVDLLRFRDINDTLGYELGDRLLVDISERLKKLSPEYYEIIRMSGDVFCVICPCDHDRANACRVANKIQDCVEAQKQIADIPLNMQTRIGMSFFPLDSDGGPELVRLADIALSQAKQTNSKISYYQADNDSHSVRKLTLLAGLRCAIEEDELSLVYQPKVNIQNNTLVGVEALVRWIHPEYGFISPVEFVGWAEKSGLIDKLTMWVLKTAEAQSREWSAAGYHIPVAINLSPVNLSSETLTRLIRQQVKDGGFDQGLLELELTENAVMEDPVKALNTMKIFDQLGIPLAIDDFGTGLSSFTYLRRFPVSNLKIDRSFVMNGDSEDRDAVLLRSMIELGHNLGCVVTAEGVEDQVVLEMLRKYGCDYVQGYHVCKPATADGVIEWYLGSEYSSEQRLAA